MARLKGDPVAILQAVVDRLIDQLGLTDATCYLSIDPDAVPSPSPGDLIFVVSPTSGNFNEAMFDGGGQEQMTLDGGIVVKIHTPVQLDEPKHDALLVGQESRGVLRHATLTLKALANWSPDKNGNELTRDPLIPSGFAIGRKSRSLGWVELTFKCSFDWDADSADAT